MLIAPANAGVIQLADGTKKGAIVDGTVYAASGCTHPKRINGKCVVCDDQEPVAAIVDANGNVTISYHLKLFLLYFSLP